MAAKGTDVSAAYRDAVEIKRALIAYMRDEKLQELHISPDAAGQVLLAPNDWDVQVSQDRAGIHVVLVDKFIDESERFPSMAMDVHVPGENDDKGNSW